MTISSSLLALLLLALSGGGGAAWVEAPSAGVPTEAPVSHDAPADAEETDGEEDGVRALHAKQLSGVVSAMTWDGIEVASVDSTMHSPPPER